MFKVYSYHFLFGIATIGIFIASIVFTIRFFPTAFPIVHLKISMNRSQALDKAAKLAAQYHWDPQSYKQSALFETDTKTKTFVELAGGGKDALMHMITQKLYYPYYWTVRHFNVGEIAEANINFTPEGELYEFSCTISEDAPGAALTNTEAQKLAEQQALALCPIDLTAFKLIESAQETKPNGRVDHIFTYERIAEKIGQGTYRLNLNITGSTLSAINHFVRVPEDFTMQYKQMRSTNDTIATTASIIMQLTYIIGGCIIGLLYLIRRRFVLWKASLFCSACIALLTLINEINQFPLHWMYYDTTIPLHIFFLNYIMQTLKTCAHEWLFLWLVFSAAEGLTRKAFGSHIQLWRIWSIQSASSWRVLFDTLAGYFFVPLNFIYLIIFYILTTRYLGWWIPSESLYNPNILATYLPWLDSIIISLKAGFMEECLFRAIPLASAALIGNYIGGRNWWIAAAFLVQIIVFGAAHANYPMQPAYARLIELIVPSCTFGFLYLSLGLLPAIIAHYLWDVIWIALPLFIASGIWASINQLLVVVCACIPIWIVLYARMRNGSWHNLPVQLYNHSWHAPTQLQKIKKIIHSEPIVSSPLLVTILGILGIISIGLWFFVTPLTTDTPPVALKREAAVNIATDAWNAYIAKDNEHYAGKTLSFYYPQTQLIAHYDDNHYIQQLFIWRTHGKDTYHALLNKYLDAPSWIINFVRFNGTLLERAEGFHTKINSDGTISELAHQLPESTQGKTLTIEQARLLAHNALQDKYDLSLDDVEEIAATPYKQPSRLDWLFTFQDKHYAWGDGSQARINITISGDEISYYYRFIHVPEVWERNEQSKQHIFNFLVQLFGPITYVLIALCILLIFFNYALSFSFTQWIITLFVLMLWLSIDIANTLPRIIAQCNTSQPLFNQLFQSLAILWVRSLMRATALATIINILVRYKMRFYTSRPYYFLIAGISLGCMSAALINVIIYTLIPSNIPVWPYITHLSTYIPSYSFISDYCMQYILSTVLLSSLFISLDIIHRLYNNNAIVYFLLSTGIYITSGLIMSSIFTVYGITQFFILAFCLSCLLPFAYAIVKKDIRCVPYISWAYIICSCIQQIFFCAYSFILSTVVATILVTLLLALLWTKSVHPLD